MLETLYKEALDRKENPKEGSYTNYLYNKGLDKILKKSVKKQLKLLSQLKMLIKMKSPTKQPMFYIIWQLC